MSNPVTVTYGGQPLIPAPILSVNKEFIYANDSIIGYTYVININGYATNIQNSNFINTVLQLKDVQNILHQNGKSLIVQCDGANLITAHGGTLRSFNMQDTENKWFNYAKYSASIEFSNVYFGTGVNTEIAEDSTTGGVLTPDLLGLRSYNDNWTFNIGEEDMYSYYSRVSSSNIVNIEDYTKINVQYNITANGKHFFDNNNNLIPAWQRAKNFVQHKLWNQIDIFRTKGPLGNAIFNSTNYNSTDIQTHVTTTLANSHTSISNTTPTILPILGGSINSQYKIYNEIITCSTSESDGSFTATYNCILKRFVGAGATFPQDSIHTFTVSYDQTRDFDSGNRTISVNGTVQGLIRTNILAPTTYGGAATESTGQVFSLPSNGYFVDTLHTSESTKYTYALKDFTTFIGKKSSYSVFSADDLSDAFKQVLEINYASLFPDTNPIALFTCAEGGVTLRSILALPQSFNVSHNYSDGTISYTAEYSTERSCAMERGFETFTVTENDAVPIYAEFTIVGRSSGPLIQNLNTNKAKTITFDFEGTTRKGCVLGTPFSVDYQGILNDVCNTNNYLRIPQKVLCMINSTEFNNPELIPQSYNISYNPIDGAYKLSKTYLVCSSGVNLCP